MSSMLSLLVGQRISKAERLYDYAQLWFDSGDLLNIFNVYVVLGCESETIAELVGCDVSSITETDGEIELVLVGGASIRIGMHDSDYQLTELMPVAC